MTWLKSVEEGDEAIFTLLDILLGGYQLPLALAWGHRNLTDLGFSPGLKFRAWAKARSKGEAQSTR